MVTITFLAPDGVARSVEAAPGGSVMEAAVRNNVPGIDADCGGACACATCHVIVAPDWWERVGPPDRGEAEMLEFSEHVQSNSRLSCQIRISEALDGLVLQLPENQNCV